METLDGLGPLFERPHSPDHFWILTVSIALVVMATSIVVMVRGRLPAVFSSYVFLLLPAVGYLLGDLHVLEESKRVSFCGSCHETMSPLVDALKNDTESLAGLHWSRGAISHEEACYVCHSGYGIWGDVDAKKAGVNHMIHTVTGDYEYPLEISHTFDIKACLDCHAEAAPFRNEESHQDPDIQEALISGELSCAGVCHLSAHPDDALIGAAAWEASK
ncbi:MAG: hypothetical protein ACI8TX_000143 [Hyphomicrobiaceae bacterium]|jgi:hypothetical protein